MPGATPAKRPGRRREQATRARPEDTVPEPAARATAITPPIAGAQRTVPGSPPGWPSLLATRGILSCRCRTTRRNTTAETRVVCQLPEDNRSGPASSSPTLRGFGGGSDAVRRQVIQIAGPRSAGRERRAQSSRHRARTRDSGTAEANLMTLPGWSGLAAAGAPGRGTGCGGRPSSTTRPHEYSQVTWCIAFRYAPENRARPAELTAVPGPRCVRNGSARPGDPGTEPPRWCLLVLVVEVRVRVTAPAKF